jgi:hypothetical protein
MAKKTAKKIAASDVPAPKPIPPKATKPEAAKPAAPVKPAAAKASPAKATAPKAAPAETPSITGDAIGYAAGDVWGALHGQGWQTLAAVKKATDCPSDLTLMAIGWLAREGKLDFAASGKTVKLTLK